ncbi:uncharacterized protein LOC132741412 [Ruditapes philippinarum]|uniref:uncharacterized protein LOC132741412 n=1 Tax=Ruditapes philippinarum TaxID=129788 RepID=UPI00295B7EA1|nr:uncharacterized protein LOC132741412 [Ruditapes philippinarum]
MINSSSYDELQKMQEHAPIGCRVRRGRDWMWADQDNGGPGTVVGHLYDELRKYWCWVEWDIGGEINVYRWDMDGKCDLTIVDEDRQPEEEEILMVGCKVAPGEGYEGNSSHVIGIAIKYVDDNKMQVRWNDDGSRENLTYGKDGTPKQLVVAIDKGIRKQDHENCRSEGENPIVYDESALKHKSLPAPPEFLEVYDILENTANVRWQKCRDDKMSSNSKYVVTYAEKNKPQKKILVEVVAAVSCILDDLKPASEYSVDVRLISDDGESLPTNTYSFKTLETDTDDTCYEDWKLTEEDASRLAEAVGRNWQILGPPLGIRNVKLHHILENNMTVTSRIYDMFLTWVMQDEDSTFRTLCKILEKYPSVYVDRKILSEMKQEHPLESY